MDRGGAASARIARVPGKPPARSRSLRERSDTRYGECRPTHLALGDEIALCHCKEFVATDATDRWYGRCVGSLSQLGATAKRRCDTFNPLASIGHRAANHADPRRARDGERHCQCDGGEASQKGMHRRYN